MNDYPLLRAFIAELVGLTPEDAQLPLAILVRVCRTRLRAPLLILPQLGNPEGQARSDPKQVEAILDARYPALRQGSKIYPVGGCSAFTRSTLSNAQYYLWRIAVAPGVLTLIDNGRPLIQADMVDTWHSYSAVWIMYELSLPGTRLEWLAPAAEEALGLSPLVRQALLQLADLAPPEAHAMDVARARVLRWADRARSWRVAPVWLFPGNLRRGVRAAG